MTTVTVRTNAKQRAAAIRADADATARMLDQALDRGAIEIARDARIAAPKAATNTLTNSIAHARLAVGRYSVTAAARYALAVEEGAGPGGWAPLDSVLAWMRAHGVRPREEGMSEESLAKAIQRSIHRKGTRAQPFFKPAVDAALPNIERRVADGLTRIIEANR